MPAKNKRYTMLCEHIIRGDFDIIEVRLPWKNDKWTMSKWRGEEIKLYSEGWAEAQILGKERLAFMSNQKANVNGILKSGCNTAHVEDCP